MGVFEHMQVAEVEADAKDLQLMFLPYRQRHDVWDRMVYPDSSFLGMGMGALAGQAGGSWDILAGRSLNRENDDTKARRTRSQYRTNFVWTGCNWLINIWSSADINIQIATDGASAKNKAQGSMAERFARGVINDQNDKYVDLSQGRSWERRVYANAAHPAWLIGQIHVARLPGGLADISWDILEPYLCALEYEKNLKRFTHTPEMSVHAARRHLEDIAEGDYVADPGMFLMQPTMPDIRAEVRRVHTSTYWMEERDSKGKIEVFQAFLIEGKVAYSRKMREGRLPIISVPMNTMGRSYENPDSGSATPGAYRRNYVERLSEPWFACLENTLDLFNQVKSMEMDGIDLAIRPPLMTFSENGDLTVQDNRLFGGKQVTLKKDEMMRFLEYNNNAAVLNSTLVKDLKEERNQAFPLGLRSEVESADASGRAFDLRTQEAKTSQAEYQHGIETFIEKGLAEIVYQGAQAKGLKVKLDGKARTGKKMGQTYYEDFDLDGFPPSTVFQVRLAPALPKDVLRQVQIFQIAKTAGAMPLERALSDIMGSDDPTTDAEQIRLDAVQAMPDSVNDDMLLLKQRKIETLQALLATSKDASYRLVLQLAIRIQTAQYDALSQKLLGGAAGFQQAPQPGNPDPTVQHQVERGIQPDEITRGVPQLLGAGAPQGGA